MNIHYEDDDDLLPDRHNICLACKIDDAVGETAMCAECTRERRERDIKKTLAFYEKLQEMKAKRVRHVTGRHE